MKHSGSFCIQCLALVFILMKTVVCASGLSVDQEKNFQEAIRAGNRDKVVEILSLGGDELRRKVLFSSAYYLQLTARFAPPDLLLYFVDQFSLKENRESLSKALVVAIDNQHFDEVAATLIDLGADPAHEFSGMTALGRLAYLYAGKPEKSDGMLATARVLLQKGANANLFSETGETPLMTAARNDDPGLVKLLLEYGADPHLTNKDTASAFTLARPGSVVAALLEREKQQARGSLLELSAQAVEKKGKTPGDDEAFFAEPMPQKIMRMSQAAAFGDKEQLEELLRTGIDPNAAVDPSGITALMQAADAEVAQLLLDAGAEAGRADQDGWTALHYAATRESNAGLVERLIRAGAGINARTSRGETPLRLAGILFTEKISPAWGEVLIALLVQKGADINSPDLEGHTLLHQAAFNDNAELAAVCLRHGADLDKKNVADRTPRQVAQELGSKKFLQVMEK